MYKMLTYRITTKFGEIDNFHPKPHTGIDYATPLGTHAQSIADGVVKVASDPMLGDNVRVVSSGSQEWVYGHLSQVNVSTGQHVSAGDVLGLTGGIPGTPGAGHSTGAHLHLTALQNGVPVDPTAALTTKAGGWERFWDVITTPGTELAGMAPVPGPFEMFLNWVDGKMIQFIHISPEILTVIAMTLLLIGMVGGKRAMRYAGTCVLLSFVGVMLSAAIS